MRGGRREKRENVNKERTRDTTCERRATREEGAERIKREKNTTGERRGQGREERRGERERERRRERERENENITIMPWCAQGLHSITFTVTVNNAIRKLLLALLISSYLCKNHLSLYGNKSMQL